MSSPRTVSEGEHSTLRESFARYDNMRHPRRSQKQLIAGNSKTASNEPTRLPGTPDLTSVPGAVNGFVNVQESTRHGGDIGLEAQMMTTGYTGALVFAAVTALPTCSSTPTSAQGPCLLRKGSQERRTRHLRSPPKPGNANIAETHNQTLILLANQYFEPEHNQRSGSITHPIVSSGATQAMSLSRTLSHPCPQGTRRLHRYR